MLIKKLNRNTFDVFGNTGFDSWTRVRKFHWGIKPVAGVLLDRDTAREVLAAIERAPHGSNENV